MTIPDRLAAALAERYRIERPLGQGGMATVYLAADLKHDRRVAIKVLKPELAAVLGAERFVQEIKTTAALSHPHILPLFDSGEADGFLYYVMPYIEGETIRDRLNRENQLGVDEAVRITCEIADALDYAHRHGVIHRDIKPENLLLHDGRAMVMDFGIALAVSAAAGGRMTETGLSLGTPHYMSPEQATADRDISARSDIYSLASVCYEMLAGDPPHTASSAQAIIMKIVTEAAAPVTTRRKSVPPHVAAAVAKALEKLPADRFETAGAFSKALVDRNFTTTTSGAGTGAASLRGWKSNAASPLALVAILLAALAAWGWLRPAAQGSSTTANAIWMSVDPPHGIFENYPGPALSPNGTRLAFFAVDAAGVRQLFVRSFDSPVAQPVAGTAVDEADANQQPFWSPDGKSIAYFSKSALYRVDLDGRAPLKLADAPNPRGGSWGSNGVILFVPASATLHSVPADGGVAAPLAGSTAQPGVTNRWPFFLPDGRHFLILRRAPGEESTIFVGTLDGPELRRIISVPSRAEYADGAIYYKRDGALFAHPFDPDKLELTGTAIRVADDVGVNGADNRNASFSAAAGHVVTWTGVYARHSQLALYDANGRRLRTVGQPAFMLSLSLQPGDGRVAVELLNQKTGIPGIWAIDLASGLASVVATNTEGLITPEWLPNGTEVLYSEFHASTLNRQSLTNEVVTKVRSQGWITSITPDGGSALLSTSGVETGTDITVVPLTEGGTPRAYLATRHIEQGAVISPDGTWVAYTSNESGRFELFVQSFPTPGNKQIVSDGFATQPIWSADGQTLYYLNANTEVVAARMARSGGAPTFTRRTLFRAPPMSALTGVRRGYVVLADGTFLFNVLSDSVVPRTMRIGLNWAGR